MAEGYDTALRRRLDVINGMGEGATQMMMRRPGMFGQPVRTPGNIGQPVRRPGNIGGSGHDRLIALGKLLQQQGFRVGENSFFNGGRRITGGHARNSRHYSDRAIDVNFGPGGRSRQETDAINRILPLIKQYGLRYIWQSPNHYDHIHIDY